MLWLDCLQLPVAHSDVNHNTYHLLPPFLALHFDLIKNFSIAPEVVHFSGNYRKYCPIDHLKFPGEQTRIFGPVERTPLHWYWAN